MANDAVEDPQAEQPAGPNLLQIGLVGALARLMTDHQKKVLTPRTDGPKEPLIKGYVEGGQSDLVIRVGEDVIGRYKVSTVRPKIVVDEDNETALNKYADENGGTEVVVRRNETWEESLLRYTKYDEDSGLIIDTRNGQIVPGLKHIKGGDPTGALTFTWEQKDVGKKRLLRLYESGALDHLLKDTPELMAGPRPSEDAQN